MQLVFYKILKRKFKPHKYLNKLMILLKKIIKL